MSAFCIFDNIAIHDAEKLDQYASKAAPVVAKYGGKYRVIGGASKILEGEWNFVYPVIIEFDSVAQAEAWYFSADYEPLKRMRQSAIVCNAVLVEVNN